MVLQGPPGAGKTRVAGELHAALEILPELFAEKAEISLPLVPGSAREVPPWVLAGPVLQRLASLLGQIRKGFRMHEDVRQSPRGQILWTRYVTDQMNRGAFHQLPCRYPELGPDALLRSYLEQLTRAAGLPSQILARGIQALGWIVDANKDHMQELDEARWFALSDELREEHRHDLHQILAYASVFEGSEITAVLVYPMHSRTWARLADYDRTVAHATLASGGRFVHLVLVGVPMQLPPDKSIRSLTQTWNVFRDRDL